MKIGPKFKIAKRLGAPIFAKTQTAKFALSEARAGKMRFTYGVSEKQLRRYIAEAVNNKSGQPITSLIVRLESRLDNVVYRLGLAKTRQFARQMVAHGHIHVNGKRIKVPSHKVRVGDVISVRPESRESGMYTNLVDEHETASVPAWLTFDLKNFSGEVKDAPTYEPSETMFDPQQVLEYYSR